MTTLKVGIASYEEMKARTMAVARGKRRAAVNEPKVWFTSTESFAKVLSAGNRDLLRMISEKAPGSLDELARITGKAKSNLSRYQEYLLYEDVMRRRPGERPFGRLPHFPAVLAGMAATEAFALITNAYPATTLGRVVVMDLLTSESESHDVLRVPRCPACGRLARRAKGSRPSQRLTWAPGVGDVAD